MHGNHRPATEPLEKLPMENALFSGPDTKANGMAQPLRSLYAATEP
jgi:hypothetical protein